VYVPLTHISNTVIYIRYRCTGTSMIREWSMWWVKIDGTWYSGKKNEWGIHCTLTEIFIHCKSGTGTKSHLTRGVSNMLHNYPLLASLEAYLAHHMSKKGEAYLTHVKQNMLHMWLIVRHLTQLFHIVCHIWLCAGTNLQCSGILRSLMYKNMEHQEQFFTKLILILKGRSHKKVCDIAPLKW
jgi:hypothetical protein